MEDIVIRKKKLIYTLSVRIIKLILTILFFSTLLQTSYSKPLPKQKLIAIVNGEMRQWANNPIIIEAVKEQNKKYKNTPPAQLRQLNNTWHQELKTHNKPLIRQVIHNNTAEYLDFIISRSEDLYTYILVTDKNGLSVAQTEVTPDYWHGNQDYWLNTLGNKTQRVFIEDVRFSNTTQMFQSRVSFTLIDQEKMIGAITVGINVEAIK